MRLNLNDYYEKISELIKLNSDVKNRIKRTADLFKSCHKKGGKVVFFGNGGSASTSSHISVDLTKNAKVRSVNFNESNLITCFSNDYAYDKWIEKAIEFYCDKKDIVVLISVSGTSKNILNAAKFCQKKNISLITFSGFKKKNSLIRINKKGFNFWVNSKSYNQVEIVHHIYLLSIVDYIIGKSNYSV